MDVNSEIIIPANAGGTEGLMGCVPGDLVALVLAKLENFRADNDVSAANIRLQPTAKPRADNEVGAVAANGHFGGDASALLADTEGKKSDGLTAERALVEIEMFLADDMVGVCPVQNGAEFLTYRNENGNHGSRCFLKAPLRLLNCSSRRGHGRWFRRRRQRSLPVRPAPAGCSAARGRAGRSGGRGRW